MKLTFISGNNSHRCLAVIPVCSVPGLCVTPLMLIFLHCLMQMCTKLLISASWHEDSKNFSHVLGVNTDVRVLFGELDRAKMSNNASGNICRTGCGRPGQRDYGWKGPAFNCCFGTVACLVEHKRPVRHASVARTCEYLPDWWNAPLFSSSPSPANPNPDPCIQLALRAPVWLTWGRKRRCMQAPHAKKSISGAPSSVIRMM